MIHYETELYHHGVKGQKWGRRKQKTKNEKRPKGSFFNIKQAARRRAYDKNGNLKSTGQIVRGSIGRTVGIAGGMAAVNTALGILGDKGLMSMNTQGLATTGVSSVAALLMARETAVGITSSIQRGRGRYSNKR